MSAQAVRAMLINMDRHIGSVGLRAAELRTELKLPQSPENNERIHRAPVALATVSTNSRRRS